MPANTSGILNNKITIMSAEKLYQATKSQRAKALPRRTRTVRMPISKTLPKALTGQETEVCRIALVSPSAVSRKVVRSAAASTGRTARPIIGLRLAYRVAQVCHADTRDYPRVAKDGRRAGEVVKESNAGAKQNRRDVDMDFVEQAGIQ